MKNYSGNGQYKPYWSFPHRVTDVKNGNLKAIPIYYRGKGIQIPLSKIKLLNNKTNEIYEKQMRNLIQVTDSHKRKSYITNVLKSKDYFDVFDSNNISQLEDLNNKNKEIDKEIRKGLEVIKQAKKSKI